MRNQACVCMESRHGHGHARNAAELPRSQQHVMTLCPHDFKPPSRGKRRLVSVANALCLRLLPFVRTSCPSYVLLCIS